MCLKKVFFYFYNLILNTFFSNPKFYKILSGPIKGYYIYRPFNVCIKMSLGIYEKKPVQFIYDEVNSGDYCLDLGSHVGYISVVMSKKVGQKGKVFSFDPIKKDCDYLKKTVRRNKLNNIIVNNFGVGDENVKKEASIFDDSGMAHFSKDVAGVTYGDKVSTLELIKLDDYFKRNKINKLDFIKVDVEGYEYKALLGAENIITKHKPRLLVEIHNKTSKRDVFRFLNTHGYKIYNLERKPINNKLVFEDIFHIYAEKK